MDEEEAIGIAADVATPREAVSSFELTKLAKGNYTWKIKIYSNDIEELQRKTNEMNNYAVNAYGAGYD